MRVAAVNGVRPPIVAPILEAERRTAIAQPCGEQFGIPRRADREANHLSERDGCDDRQRNRQRIFRLRLIRRAAEEECEVPDVAEIVALRLLPRAADIHVLNHAARRSGLMVAWLMGSSWF
jgi:hypothetical protein